MLVLGIDQSVNTSTAVELHMNKNGKFEIKKEDSYKGKSTGVYRLYEIDLWLNRIVNAAKPDLLVREMHMMRQYGNAGAVSGVNAMIDLLAYRCGYVEDETYIRISPGTWKKFIFGKGNLKKDTAYLVHFNRYLGRSTYLSVPPQYQVTDDNVADAIGLAVTGYVAYCIKKDRPAGITSPEVRNHLKQNTDAMFDYGKKE